ncbi:hypothetical protein ACFSC4_20980 [Deinococcus malanensis]|uniref:hypothetical protein n=1 Tax=Deinococcus malanensis TaxID=1706855 RepID=UPI003632BE75
MILRRHQRASQVLGRPLDQWVWGLAVPGLLLLLIAVLFPAVPAGFGVTLLAAAVLRSADLSGRHKGALARLSDAAPGSPPPSSPAPSP